MNLLQELCAEDMMAAQELLREVDPPGKRKREEPREEQKQEAKTT